MTFFRILIFLSFFLPKDFCNDLVVFVTTFLCYFHNSSLLLTYLSLNGDDFLCIFFSALCFRNNCFQHKKKTEKENFLFLSMIHSFHSNYSFSIHKSLHLCLYFKNEFYSHFLLHQTITAITYSQLKIKIHIYYKDKQRIHAYHYFY